MRYASGRHADLRKSLARSQSSTGFAFIFPSATIFAAVPPRGPEGGDPMNLRKAPRTLVLTAGYAALLHVAVALSLLLRYDGAPPSGAPEAWARAAVPYTALSLLGYLWAGLYHGLWRYAGTATVFQIVRGVSASALAWLAATELAARG